MRKCSDFTHFCLLARAFRTRCSSSTCSSSTCSNAISLPLARFAAAASHCFLRRERVCGCLGVSTRVLLHHKKTSASLGKAFVPYFLNFVIGTNLHIRLDVYSSCHAPPVKLGRICLGTDEVRTEEHARAVGNAIRLCVHCTCYADRASSLELVHA